VKRDVFHRRICDRLEATRSQPLLVLHETVAIAATAGGFGFKKKNYPVK
jgi:hypothetical protein